MPMRKHGRPSICLLRSCRVLYANTILLYLLFGVSIELAEGKSTQSPSEEEAFSKIM